MASAEVVNRVKQAEAEFVAAQEGVTDETPLAQAAQQYNAAVVALEVAWLTLYADAGCLTDAQQEQAVGAVRAYTAALQQSLLDAGYYEGAVDGVYGPTTRLVEAGGDAVERRKEGAERALVEAGESGVAELDQPVGLDSQVGAGGGGGQRGVGQAGS